MKRILIDTSGYSGFMRGHPGIIAAVQYAKEIFFSPVVLGELYSGFMKGAHRSKNEAGLSKFADSPRVGFLEIDEDTAKTYAAILHELRLNGTSISSNDVWVAASAMQYGLAVLTMDRDFLKVRQILVSFH